jgi:hypothetical protein
MPKKCLSLFILRNMKTGKIYKLDKKQMSFPSKASAKVMRKHLNGQVDDSAEVLNYTVTYGSDHRRYSK